MSKAVSEEKNVPFKKIPLIEFSLNEANMILAIQENKEPIEFVFNTMRKYSAISCENQADFERNYASVSDFFNEFDETYGTKHRFVKNETLCTEADCPEQNIDWEVRLPISLQKREEILQIFLKTEMAELYQEFKDSSLYRELTEGIGAELPSQIKKARREQKESLFYQVRFMGESVYTNFDFWLSFEIVGFREDQLRLVGKTIAFATGEYIYECCRETNFCTEIESGIRYFGIDGCFINFEIDVKPLKETSF